MKKCLLLPVAMTFCALWPATPTLAQSQRIYLAPDDHTDFLWTLSEGAYEAAFVEMLDYHLDQIDKTASLPTNEQARWNCDGSYWLWTYERKRPQSAFVRLIDRIRDGHVSAPLNTLVLLYGGQSTESILRGFAYAGRLERRHGVRFPIAVAQENQTLPFGVGALFAGSGAKYSWRGICGCASMVPGAGDRPHEIYRWVGLDGSSILMKWNSLLTGQSTHIGGYAEARNPSAMVDYLTSNAQFRARWPYPIAAAFGKGWDDPKTLSNEFSEVAKQKTTAARKVIVSNQIDFFEDFSQNNSSNLPALSLSYGNEWDTYVASLAEVTASVRRNIERLKGAEALATLVSRAQPGFMETRIKERDEAETAMGLYHEHDWTADGPVSRNERAAWQRRLEKTIRDYVDRLTEDGQKGLASLIQLPNGPQNGPPRYYVFNPLSFLRTDVVDLPYPTPEPLPVHVVDVPTGAELPSQVVGTGERRRVRVLVPEVPGVGYRVVEVRPQAGKSFPLEVRASVPVPGAPGTIENAAYRLTVSPAGVITSLVDKRRGNQEILTTLHGRAANDLGGGTGTLRIEEVGPVSVTLLATATTPLRHQSRVTLFGSGPSGSSAVGELAERIEIHNEIEQNFTTVQSWAFTFNIQNPDVWHEEVGAVIRVRLFSQGGRYADKGARYDWLSLNHFVDMNGTAFGVTLSSWDLSFFKLGLSTPRLLDVKTPQIYVLAGGQVDGPTLGIPGQGGDTRFVSRFALRVHGPQEGGASAGVPAMLFSLAHQNPFLSARITGGDFYPEASYSFARIEDPRVVLSALKPAEDGPAQGIIARVWNLSDAQVQAPLLLAESIAPSGALRLSHAETPLPEPPLPLGARGEVTVNLAAQQLKTLSLVPARKRPNQNPFAKDDQAQCSCRVGGRAGELPRGLPAFFLFALALCLRRFFRTH